MTSQIMPGTVLGGRYVLADLLDDVEGGRFWRAVDQVLERNVAAFVLPEDDDRVPAMLEAARLSATVTDPHLLRVLDADVDDGRAWVINEWGAGQSLDTMISQEVLSPDRAAWLVREVAAAIAVAHGRGLTHGRLCPENVMVTESGTVRLIGFAVDAAIQRGRLRSGNYPDCTPHEADLFDLAGLLYAGLVGCWPGASGSHVKAAPRDTSGPLRPRQVRAGVPRTLDAICGRVLRRSHPDRTARQLSAVLTEYIGELAAADPAVLPVALPELDSSLEDLAAVTGQTDPDGSPVTAADQRVVPADPGATTPALVRDEPVPASAPVPASEPPVGPVEEDTALWALGPVAHEDEEWIEADDEPTEVRVGAAPTDDDTQRSAPLHDDAAASDPDWHRPSSEPSPAAPSFDPLPERPLFAPEGTRRTPRGDVPRSETARWGTEVAAARIAAGDETPSGASVQTEVDEPADDSFPWEVPAAQRRPHWPLGEDDPDGVKDDWEERTRRHWLRLPLVVAVLAVVAVLVAAALTFNAKNDVGAGGGKGDPSAPPSTVTASGQRLKIAAAKDLDPYGVPPEENPDEVGNAIDGDPATSWQTLTYRGRPDLGGLKPGVGMVVDLGSIRRIGSIALRLVGSPTDVTVYAAPTASRGPTGIEGLNQVGQQSGAGERADVRLAQPVRTRYVVVWLTSLPRSGAGYRGGISEIVVRS